MSTKTQRLMDTFLAMIWMPRTMPGCPRDAVELHAPITRNLAGEFDEVVKPEPARDDSGSENEVSDKKTTDETVTRKPPGNRPPMNSSTPAANRVIGRILDQMMESSDWIRQFTPKAVRQALWVALSGELAWSVNTMLTVKVAEDTVSLLRAMGLEPKTNPSEAAFRDWLPAIAGKELKRWKRKLRLSFGTSDIGDDDGMFGVKTEGTPYFHDSHVVTPRLANRADRFARDTEASNAQRGDTRASSGRSRRRFVPRYDSSDDDSGEDDYYRKADAEYNDPSDELDRQVIKVSEMERLKSTPRLDLATHRPLAQIKAISGLHRPHGRDERRAETSRDKYRRDRHDRHGRGYGRRMGDSRHTHRISLAEASLSEMMAELQVRESKYGRLVRSKSRDICRSLGDSSSEDLKDRSTDDDQSGSDFADPYHSDEHDRHVAAANDAERRTEAIGTPPTETGLVPIELPQLVSPPVDADCVYSFVGESKWLKTQRSEEANEAQMMEIDKERNGNFGGGGSDERRNDEWNGGSSEGLVSSVTQKTWHDYEPEYVIKLLSGERLGWWSAQMLDKRVRMRALVQGAVNDARTRILLDTGANISVISERFAKQLHFTIPAGVRLDLFRATARLLDEVEIPLIKTQRMADTREEGPHVPDGPTEVLPIPGHESRDYRPMRQPPTNETHAIWVRRTKELIPKGCGVSTRPSTAGTGDEHLGSLSHVPSASTSLAVGSQRGPTEGGRVRATRLGQGSEVAQLKLEGAYLAAATVSEDWGDRDAPNASEHPGNAIEFEDYARELAFLPDLTEAASITLDYTGPHVRHPSLSVEQQDRVVKVLKSHERIMISSGKALPPPAYGDVCDIRGIHLSNRRLGGYRSDI
ncbi:unnamed protein product [Phytophthora fragariaefolia]|uniref:Unnamed protein product n=1 Tax=Phytophthora fragariaefolia TaxID=1490495 RepID=A0A9W7D480_9STRA|nr:unnamed protein product [Phytophthora fragariaefolia]